MTDDLKLVEQLRSYRPTNEWGDPCHHVICDAAASAIERLVRERDEARNSLIQARNERDEDRQRRRDLHARHAVEITALRADRDRLAKLVAEMREAKNGFGLMIDTARAGPVLVEKHGRGVVVVLAVEEYERLKAIEAGQMSEQANKGGANGEVRS